MAIMLPDHLATALNFVGIPWPNIDEDELRNSARDLREFASSLTESVKDTSGVVSDTAGQTDAAFAKVFAVQWEGRPGEIEVLSAGCDVLARALEVIAGAVEIAKKAVLGALGTLVTALGVEFFLTGGLADLLAGGFEVEIAERAITAALDLLEQEVAGQLIGTAIQPLTDQIPATVRKFLAGSAEAVPTATALKADYAQLNIAATRLDTHAHRTETTGETLRRRSSSRNFARGGSPIGATLKQALETVLKDLAEQIPKIVAQVQRDMGLFLKKAAKDLEEADKKLTADARTVATAAVGRGHPEPSFGGRARTGTARDDIRGNINHQTSRPTDKLHCETDPVDVAAGRVVLTQTDVELAGVLPLVLSRTHLSSYRVGHWFGPSWASTLDQRLEIEDTGVYYAAEDGMLLAYPTPPTDGVSVLPEEGPRWPLRRAEDGSYTITDPQRGHTRHFAPAGASLRTVLPLSAVTDRIGHRIDLDYAGNGALTEIRHSGGYRIGVETVGGRITALRLREANTDVVLIRYGYDRSGRLTEVTNSSGIPLRFDYDADGRLTSWQDRNGVAYRYTYDEAGRCVRTSGAGGYMNATFRYDQDTAVTVFINSLGHATTFHLNELGQVVREIDPLANSTVSVWDRYDRLLARTDPLGRTTRYRYDQAGNLVAITRPDGTQALADYNELHLPVTVTNPDGALWRRVYDERGTLTAVIDPLGASTNYSYDEWGHLSAVTDALGYRRRVQTDAAGLLTAVTDPLGATTYYARDGFGRVSALTDPVGGVTRLGWTIEGQLAWRTLPDGATEHWRYDGEGNLVEHLDALGQATRTEFTYFDLPAAQVEPDGARLEFCYDTELRLVSVTNPQGLVWRYDYDPAGNLIRETDFNRRELHYVHDSAGQLIERTNGAGQASRFVRDLLGAVVEQRSAEAVATFGYDAAGRMVRATNAHAELVIDRDPLGRVLAETCNGRTVTSRYDALGRRTQRRTPSGAESVWEYGAGEAPLALRTAGRTLRFGYDPAGREIERRVDAGAVLTQSWDANHRLSSQTLTASGPGPSVSAREERLVQRRSYRYRPDGYVTTIEDHLGGLRRFDLDPAGRVTAVHGTGWTERYAYDPAGNITNAAWPAPPQPDSLDADARGEREYTGTLIRRAGNVRYQHDAQGRVVLRQQKRLSAKPRTWHYIWDADDRLTAVTTPDGQRWRYHYDPFGRRIAKQRLGADGDAVVEQVDFTWDGVVLAEQTHTTGPDNPARTTTWDWEPDTFRPVTQTERTPLRDAPQDWPQEWVDEQFYAIVTDLVDAPAELIDATGNIAWRSHANLWGNPTSMARGPGTVECLLRFPGQYHDYETQLNYNYFRYYDSATARYASSDPIGLEGGDNPYDYVSNPINSFDPLGLMSSCMSSLGRGPIIADNDLLVNASRGHVEALSEIRAGTTYVTPNQYREFLAGGAGRRQFLEQEDIRLFGGPDAGRIAASPEFQSTFQSVVRQQGRGDAALVSFARATGYEAVTMERRLFNFVTKTLQDPAIPIRRVMP